MTSGEHGKWFTFACLLILGLALTANLENSAERAVTTNDTLNPIDFQVFYLGGKIALQKGTPQLYYPPADRHKGYTLLYQFADPAVPWAQMARDLGIAKILQFTNPPFAAVIMEPFALIPWQWGYLIWQFIIIALTGTSIYLALRLLPTGPSLETFALMFAAVTFFYPFKSTLVFGQVNVSILFLWTLGVYLLARQRPMASGLCFALGTVLKIAPVVAVPLLALRRQWKWLAAYVGGVIAFTAISIWRLGWQTNLIWVTGIYPCISSGVGSVSNRSLAGFVDALVGPRYFANLITDTEWPVPHGLSLFEKACSLAIGLGFIYWCWRQRKDAKGLIDELILLPLVYLLTAPFTWAHHYVLAILPLVYLWGKAREATSNELTVLCIGTLALGTELPMYSAAYSPWASPYLIMLALAICPSATCAIICVGIRMYLRSRVFEPQSVTAV